MTMNLPKYLILAVLILLLGYGLRMVDLGSQPLWVDENYTNDTIEETRYGDGFIVGMRARLTHMPVYFASLLIYPDDHSRLSLRFPSVLLSLLVIAMTMRVMTHIYHAPRWALFAGLLLALHATLILHSRTARMYPLTNFLLATSSYIFLRYSTRPAYRARIIGYITNAIAYLTHVASFILIPAQGLTKLRDLLQRKISLENVVLWLVLQGGLAIPALLWASLIFNTTFDGLFWIEPPTLIQFPFVLQSLMLGIVSPDIIHIWWFAIPAFAIPLLAFFRYSHRIRFAEYWLGLTILPMIALFATTPIKPLFHERYFSVAVFAYVLLVVLGLRELDRQWGAFCHRRLMISSLCLVIVLVILLFTILQMPDGYFVRPNP